MMLTRTTKNVFSSVHGSQVNAGVVPWGGKPKKMQHKSRARTTATAAAAAQAPSRPNSSRSAMHASSMSTIGVPATAAARRTFHRRRAPHVAAAASSNNDGKSKADSHCTLLVSVTKHVPFGTQLRLVGSVPACGNWDPERGVEMEWTDGDVWTCDVCMISTPSDGHIEYKYVLVNVDDATGEETYTWQEGANRLLHAEPPSCEVQDTWVHERGACVAMLERVAEAESADEEEVTTARTAAQASAAAATTTSQQHMQQMITSGASEITKMRNSLQALEQAIEREEKQYLEHWHRLHAYQEQQEQFSVSEEQADEALLQQAAAISALEAERELFLDRLAAQERELKAKDSALSELQAELRVAARARAALAQQLVQKRCDARAASATAYTSSASTAAAQPSTTLQPLSGKPRNVCYNTALLTSGLTLRFKDNDSRSSDYSGDPTELS
ncbi:CBM20 domain-containing protein [Pseudoscourfieldia marina]